MSELSKRIYTAIPLILLTLFAIFYLPVFLFNICATGLYLALSYEWRCIHQPSDQHIYYYLLLILFGFSSITYCSVSFILLVTITLHLFMAGFMFWIMQTPQQLHINTHTALTIGALHLTLSWYVLIHLKQTPLLLGIGISTITLSDIYAYLVGKYFGKTYLPANINACKTWEGVVAGILLPIATLTILGTFFFRPFSLVELLTLLATTSFAVLGDLYESFFKRKNNLKNSGYLLPGHGGLLDRLDSLIVALPIFRAGLHFCNILPY